MRSLLFTSLAVVLVLTACGDEKKKKRGHDQGGGGSTTSQVGGSTPGSGGTGNIGNFGGNAEGGVGNFGGNPDGGFGAATSSSTSNGGFGGSGQTTTVTTGTGMMGWNCDPAYYGMADGCDCGCGIQDPDCPNLAVASCQYCDDPGSCGTGACPANINPNNNAVCQ
jgi:hypothetical protein